MILLFLVILILLLCIQFVQPTETLITRPTKKTSWVSYMLPPSPVTVLEGLHKRVHPYIPYKQHFYKLKRRFRYR
jgi:hypothetical protein